MQLVHKTKRKQLRRCHIGRIPWLGSSYWIAGHKKRL